MLQMNELMTRSDISQCTTFYLSDRQSTKMVNSYEDLEQKAYYLNKFIEDLMSLFVWENLPNDIPSYIIEYLLLSVGRCLMYEDEEQGLCISRYAMMSFNDYYEPVQVNTISIATSPRRQLILYDDEFEYCWNNNSGAPLFNMAYTMADRLYHIEKTISYIQKQMRRPTIFSGSKSMKTSLEKIMNENDPQTWYVINKEIEKLSGIPITNLDVGKGLEVLIKLRMMYLQEWNSRVAVHSVEQYKKERSTEGEVDGFGEMANINIAGMFQQRLRFAEMINKHWGLNVNVRYNSIISTRGEKEVEETEESEVVENED